MAHHRSFTYRLRLAGATAAVDFEVVAFGRGEADTYAYREACKLGARPGNVEAFDCIRSATA